MKKTNDVVEEKERRYEGPRMLDWYRHKTDFRTMFLNYSTLFGNVAILLVLLGLLFSVNMNWICIPDTLLLNPAELRIIGCDPHVENATQPTVFLDKITIPTTTDENTSFSLSHHPKEETQIFYLLNMVVICLVLPLGLASMVNSLSEYWIVKVQNLKWIIKLRLQVDGILAASAIFSTFLFAFLLLPIGINSVHLTSNSVCYVGGVMNITSSVALSIIGVPSLAIGIKSIMILRKGLKHSTKEKLKQEGKTSSENMFNEAKKMAFSFATFLIMLTITILHFHFLWDLLFSATSTTVCFRPNELYYTTIYLITCDLIILLLTLFLSCFYTAKLYMCKTLAQTKNKDMELYE